MIPKLAFNNIKKSLKIYIIYIFTLTLTIALFYGFMAINDSQVLVKLKKEAAEYIMVFLYLINITTYFISFFVTFLIIYASDFFFKVRSHEYYVYKTLGMGKKELRKLIFFENLIVGIVSILMGIILGILFNYILNNILISYINLDNGVSIVVSIKAIIKTIMYFFLILLIVTIFSARKINKKTIINLKNIKSAIIKKQMEKYKSIVLIITSILILITSYISGYCSQLNPGNPCFTISIFCGFIGSVTFYFGWINLKNTKFRTQNHDQKTLEKSLFYNRLMKNKLSISMISVSFVFILITLFGSNSLIKMFDLNSVLPAENVITNYSYPNFDLNSLNLEKNNIKDKNIIYSIFTYYDEKSEIYFPVIKQSEFNRIMIFLNYNNKISKEPFEFIQNENESNQEQLTKLKIPNNQKVKIINDTEVYKIMNSSILIVQDQKLDELIKENRNKIDADAEVQTLLINYQDKSDEEKVKKMIENNKNVAIIITTKEEMFKSTLCFKISIIFITMYIAFFLVIISLAILAIQQIMDAIDNKQEYKKLKLLGYNNKELRRIINKNTNKYFFYPVTLAFINSIFGIICINNFIKVVANKNILNYLTDSNTLIILIILVIIYIVYLEFVKSIYYKIVGV